VTADIDNDEDYADYVRPILPEVAENYTRLRADKGVNSVIEKLKRKGLSDLELDVLLRNVANLSRDYDTATESWTSKTKRRVQLAKKLRKLAEEVANDPDLRGLGWFTGPTVYADDRAMLDDATSLTDLMNAAAIELDTPETIRVVMIDETISAAEFERRTSPKRKMSRRRYVCLAIFDLLKLYFSDEATTRAPNKETALLASALLQEEIDPNAITQLREGHRRRYYKD